MLSVKDEDDTDCGIIFVDPDNMEPVFERKKEQHTKYISVSEIRRKRIFHNNRKRCYPSVSCERSTSLESTLSPSSSVDPLRPKAVLTGPIKTRQVKTNTPPVAYPSTSFEAERHITKSNSLPSTIRQTDTQLGINLVELAARLTNDSIQDLMAKIEIPKFDVMSMITEVSKVPNKNSPLYRALCANVALAASHNAISVALANLTETVKLMRAAQASTDDKTRAETVVGFGTFPCPKEEYRLKGTEYGKGVSLNKVYKELTERFRGRLHSEADYFSFFTSFLETTCMKAYDKPNWPYLTVRMKKRKNEKIELDHDRIIAFMKACHDEGGQPVDYRFEDNTLKLFITVLNNFRRRIKRTVLEEGADLEEFSEGTSSEEECSDMTEIKTE